LRAEGGNEYAKELLAEQPMRRRLRRAGLGQLHHRKPFWRRAILSYVRGIHGDKKLGMQQLGKAIDEDGICSRLRRFCWRWRHAEKNRTRGAELLLELSEEFPQSPFTPPSMPKRWPPIPQRCVLKPVCTPFVPQPGPFE